MDRILGSLAPWARCRDLVSEHRILEVRIRTLSLALEEVVVLIRCGVLKMVEGHNFEICTACHLIETDGLLSLLLEEVL